MSTPTTPRLNTDGGHHVDAVRGERACFYFFFLLNDDDKQTPNPIPFEFGVEDTKEKVVHEVSMHPLCQDRDIRLIPCGKVKSRGEDDVSRFKAWARRGIVHGIAMNWQPTKELRSIFPDGPPSMKKPGVVDFIVTDAVFVSNEEARARFVSGCGFEIDSGSEFAKIIEHFLDLDFDEEYKKDLIHIPVAEERVNQVDIARDLRGTRHIYVREPYRQLFQKLQLVPKSTVAAFGGVVITGQPGIGKTTFLWFMFLCCIMKRYAVVFNITGTTYVLFDSGSNYKTTVKPLLKYLHDLRWVLIDIDKLSQGENRLDFDWCLFHVPIIQTSSPNIGNFPWAGKSGCLWGMPLWTREEIMKAARSHDRYDSYMEHLRQMINERRHLGAAEIKSIVQEEDRLANLEHDRIQPNTAYMKALGAAPNGSAECVSSPERIFEHELDRQIVLWGPIVRDVLTGIYSGTRQLIIRTNAALAKDANATINEIINMFNAQPDQNTDRPSHRVFMVSPPDTIGGYRPSDNSPDGGRWLMFTDDPFKVEFRSKWMIDEFNRNSQAIDKMALRKLNRSFNGVKEGSTMQGWILEQIAFDVLNSKAELDKLRVAKMVLNDATGSKSPGGRNGGGTGRDGAAQGASSIRHRGRPQKAAAQGASTKLSRRNASGKAANTPRCAGEKPINIPEQDGEGSGTLSQKRPRATPDTPRVAKKQRNDTAPTRLGTQETDSRPPSNHSMKNGGILPYPVAISSNEPSLPTDSHVSSGPVLVAPTGVAEESFGTVAPASASLSSADETHAAGDGGLTFSSSGEASATEKIPFSSRDRKVVIIEDCSIPFLKAFSTQSQRFDYLRKSIFTPAAPNHPLFDGFLVDFPNVWFIQVTRTKHHGGSVEGWPIIESVLSNVQVTANAHYRAANKREAVRAKYLLVNDLPFHKRTWTLPGPTKATEGDVYCLHVDTESGV